MLRQALTECTRAEFIVNEVAIEQSETGGSDRIVSIQPALRGSGSVVDLTDALSCIEGVVAISSDDEYSVV